jgi:4-amino-4-deoxy-L-arabinose transferase-like glycosyltransferase
MIKKVLILFGFIILKFILQYNLISPEYNLQRDEYLHLDLGHHLAWGYLSVPPFTSWISKIIYLLGNSVFWIKFFPALFGALTILVVWKAIEELKGNLFALILGATCVLFSALLRLNTLYQPNSFDVLSWTLFFFIIIKYFNSEKLKWLFVASIIFAFGFLNKYNIIFLLLGLIPAILLTQQRKVFSQKKLYIAALLGLFLIAPNLLWQYNNNFPIIHHLNELANTQLVNMDRFDFLKSQLLFFIGSLFVIISALYALLFYKPFKKSLDQIDEKLSQKAEPGR